MNRFAVDHPRRSLPLGALLSGLIFLLILFLAIQGIASVSETTSQKSLESLEAALRRDVVHCYATEGFYPPSLEYLEEHYGLTYNKNRYWIDYQPVGSNLMPDITVLEIH